MDEPVILYIEQIQGADLKCYYGVWLLTCECVKATGLEDKLQSGDGDIVDDAKNALKAASVWHGQGDTDDSQLSVIAWAKQRAKEMGYSIRMERPLPCDND